MKAWTSLTDTSVVKTYREVPALRNNAFREFARFLNMLSRNKFASLQNFETARENVATLGERNDPGQAAVQLRLQDVGQRAARVAAAEDGPHAPGRVTGRDDVFVAERHRT